MDEKVPMSIVGQTERGNEITYGSDSALYPRTTTLAPFHATPLSTVLATGDELDKEVPDGQEDVGNGGDDRRDDLRTRRKIGVSARAAGW